MHPAIGSRAPGRTKKPPGQRHLRSGIHRKIRGRGAARPTAVHKSVHKSQQEGLSRYRKRPLTCVNGSGGRI